jgi:hypothetical protein
MEREDTTRKGEKDNKYSQPESFIDCNIVEPTIVMTARMSKGE